MVGACISDAVLSFDLIILKLAVAQARFTGVEPQLCRAWYRVTIRTFTVLGVPDAKNAHGAIYQCSFVGSY
jgi:hypothetical protein